MPFRIPNQKTLHVRSLATGLYVRLEAFFKMNNTRLYTDKRFHFLGICLTATLGTILVLPTGDNAEAAAELTVIPTAAAAVPMIDLTRHDLFLEEGQTGQRNMSLKLKYGDSLGPLLQKNGVEAEVAYAATKAFSSVFNPRQLRVGQKFDLVFENDRLTNLTFKPNLERTIFLTRRDDDSFAARDVAAEFQTGLVTVKSTIKNSLYLDANTLGAPDKVIQQFANIYEYSVDFQRDIQPGDAFEMFFEVAASRRSIEPMASRW